ncbi:hypothetical protein NL676_001625 [Syzygium grande]|nr:hypothetical protein NL676_001625 [Syzygium grande]
MNEFVCLRLFSPAPRAAGGGASGGEPYQPPPNSCPPGSWEPLEMAVQGRGGGATPVHGPFKQEKGVRRQIETGQEDDLYNSSEILALRHRHRH